MFRLVSNYAPAGDQPQAIAVGQEGNRSEARRLHAKMEMYLWAVNDEELTARCRDAVGIRRRRGNGTVAIQPPCRILAP